LAGVARVLLAAAFLLALLAAALLLALHRRLHAGRADARGRLFARPSGLAFAALARTLLREARQHDRPLLHRVAGIRHDPFVSLETRGDLDLGPVIAAHRAVGDVDAF